MSAALQDMPVIKPMCMADIDAIMEIELQIYPFPWTRGNFVDSLNAGYSCWIYQFSEFTLGYGIMMLAAGEAHLLNLAIAPEWQSKGMGRKFLQHLIRVAKDYRADIMFLEVRPSNIAARRLYNAIGFNEITVRRNYYPDHKGREDAILMGLPL